MKVLSWSVVTMKHLHFPSSYITGKTELVSTSSRRRLAKFNFPQRRLRIQLRSGIFIMYICT